LQHVINTTEPGWVPIDLQRRMSYLFKATDGAKNLTLFVHAYYVNKNMTHSKTPFVTDARKREDMTEVRTNMHVVVTRMLLILSVDLYTLGTRQ